MKTSLFALAAAALLFACSSRHATTTTTMSSSTHAAYTVPGSVSSSFTSQYPDATEVVWGPYDATTVPVDWDVTDWTVLGPKDYVVTYTMGGKHYYSYYDAGGNWIGTSYGITDYTNGLNTSINNTISTKYPGYTIERVNQVIWRDHTAYDVKLKNGDNRIKVLLDADGTVLKEKMK